MTTRLDLPDTLVSDLQSRARLEGKDWHEVATDLMRAGLMVSPPATTTGLKSPRIVFDPVDGMPTVVCAANAPASRMTGGELLAFEREARLREDLEGASMPR